MLVNEVCKECSLTKKAVEYYVEQGLIRPEVTENGYQHFSKADVLKLKRIAVLRGLGFSVPEIRSILVNDDRTPLYNVLNKKEIEIAEMQTKQELIRELAESGDWEQIERQVKALQSKQSILNRILDKFPGSYGKFMCLHFAPFLSEAITTKEQQEAFETVICYLDGITMAIPDDMQEYLDEVTRNTDATTVQSTSAALTAAMADPEQYIHPCGRVRSAEGLSAQRESRLLPPLTDIGGFAATRGWSRLPARSALQSVKRFEVSTGDPRPLAPLRCYPCTPTKTVHPPLASVPFLWVLLSYPGGDTHSYLPLEHRHCEPRKRQISRCRSRLPKRRKADKRMGRNDP